MAVTKRRVPRKSKYKPGAELHTLGLLETAKQGNLVFTRVPGGWMVLHESAGAMGFLPYNVEFKP